MAEDGQNHPELNQTEAIKLLKYSVLFLYAVASFRPVLFSWFFAMASLRAIAIGENQRRSCSPILAGPK
jgi:hypothetical protein